MGHSDYIAASIGKPLTALLALEDGSLYPGIGFGAEGVSVGEVVFTTAMTGYQETLTDPSYHRQIVIPTVTHVGNVGINGEDPESRRIWVAGFVVRALSPVASSWRSEGSLDSYLRDNDVIGISGIETRALVRHLRTGGVLRGAIAHGAAAADADGLIAQARAWSGMDGLDLTGEVSCASPYSWGEAADRQWYPMLPPHDARRPVYHVVAYDFGIKYNILRLLTERGCRVTVVPAATSAADVLALQPDGIFISNGPGDPSAAIYAVESIRKLIDQRPMFGICLGQQLIGLALNGQTHKLLFGHRGANQPVIDPVSGAVTITTHNHGFAVTEGTLPEAITLSRINLNDSCVEGLSAPGLKLFSVQYHPEAGPGPHDAIGLFDHFLQMMARFKQRAEQPDRVLTDLRILVLPESDRLPITVQRAFDRWRVEQAQQAISALVAKRLPPFLTIAHTYLERLQAAEHESIVMQNLSALIEVIAASNAQTGLNRDYLMVVMSQRLNPWGVIEFQGDFANAPSYVQAAARQLWRLCDAAGIDAMALWADLDDSTLAALDQFYDTPPQVT